MGKIIISDNAINARILGDDIVFLTYEPVRDA
jgi:hypothetical protein